MTSESLCRLVLALKLARVEYKESDPLLSDVAHSAIGIVTDMEMSGVTPFALDSLHELIKLLAGERAVSSMEDYLANETTDCAICTALKERLQST